MKKVIGIVVVLSFVLGQLCCGNINRMDAKADITITLKKGKTKTLTILGNRKIKETKWNVKNKK